MVAPEDVLSFWLDEIGEAGWYNPTEELDQKIRDKFGDAWQSAREGAYALWLTYPSGTLAYIILMDQFPRNMFRGEGKAFATDKHAAAAAKVAIHRKWDMRIDEPARQFFYLPLMHSENLCDQDRCVRLMCERMPEGGPEQSSSTPKPIVMSSGNLAVSPIGTRRLTGPPPRWSANMSPRAAMAIPCASCNPPPPDPCFLMFLWASAII